MSANPHGFLSADTPKSASRGAFRELDALVAAPPAFFFYRRGLIQDVLARVVSFPEDLCRPDVQAILSGMSVDERHVLGICFIKMFPEAFP